MASTDWVRRRRREEREVCSAEKAELGVEEELWREEDESGRCAKRCCSLCDDQPRQSAMERRG